MSVFATPSMVVLPDVGFGQSMTLGLTEFCHGFQRAFARLCRPGDGAERIHQMDPALRRGDQRRDHHRHTAPGEIMSGKIVDAHIQSGFHRRDAVIHDQPTGTPRRRSAIQSGEFNRWPGGRRRGCKSSRS